MKTLTALGLGTALLAAPAFADGKRLVVTDAFDVSANWAMYAAEAYIGTRAGCYESLTKITHDLRVEPLLATSW